MGSHVAGLATAAREDPAQSVGPTGVTDVSIVIVSYNSRDAISECLASVERAGPTAATETIVVDNASSDGTPDAIRRRFPWVRVAANAANLGYARAVNQGVGLSSGRYVLVLNPDVTAGPGSIDGLVRFMDSHGDAGMSASKLLNPDGTLQYSCRRFYTFLTLLLRRSFLGKIFRNSRAVADYLMLDYDHEESRPVDWVIGACMMVRREALRDIGLMDERFFLYFEDVDWCYRTWQGGWRVYYVAESVMVHRHTRASAQIRLPRQVMAHAASLFHFYEKWGKAVYDVKRYKRVLSGALLLASDLVAVNGSFAIAYALRSSMAGLLSKPMFGVRVYAPFLVFANIVIVLTFGFLELYSARAERETRPRPLREDPPGHGDLRDRAHGEHVPHVAGHLLEGARRLLLRPRRRSGRRVQDVPEAPAPPHPRRPVRPGARGHRGHGAAGRAACGPHQGQAGRRLRRGRLRHARGRPGPAVSTCP